MKTTKIRNGAGVLALLAALPSAVYAQDQGIAAIQKKLESEYQLTKTTDDKSDIVTAGSVLVLHKDKVLMVAATSAANPCMNTYRDGKITPSGACKVGDKIRRIPGLGSRINADSAPATRNFVSGEKFWVTKIAVRDTGKDRGVVFDFFTDAINDVRFKGVLTIPFGALTPTPDEALKAVAEVITVAPSEDAKEAKGDDKKQPAPQGGQQEAAAPPSQPAAPPAAPAPTEAPPAPIEPPPPPPPDPAEVAEGQTVEQVVAALGQPQKKAKVGTKEIYYYKDLKVTFVNGKVKDIQ